MSTNELRTAYDEALKAYHDAKKNFKHSSPLRNMEQSAHVERLLWVASAAHADWKNSLT